ncbi:MAG: HD domain-containing protein, partial [bacterium]
MADEENWIVLIPFDGGDSLSNIGYKHHFELLEEVAPDLHKEVNHWAAGLNAPMSGERILARGKINHLNKICFDECPGDRNVVYDIVFEKMREPFKTSKASPYADVKNILALLVARARNEYIPDEEDLHDIMVYGRNIVQCEEEEILNCLNEVMSGENPAAAIRLAEQLKILQFMLPEVSDTKGFWQKYKKTSAELFTHLLMTLDRVARNSDKRNLRWAALLHDIGKLKAVWVDEDGRTHFHTGPDGQGGDHEKIGAEMAREMLEDLGMPEEDIKSICFMVGMHMFKHFDSEDQAKDFVEIMGGEDQAYEMLTLRVGDMQGKPKQAEGEEEIREMRKLIKKVCSKTDDWERVAPDSELLI